MGRIAEGIHARVQKLSAPTADAPTAEPASAPEPTDAAPPAEEGSGADSGPAAVTSASADVSATPSEPDPTLEPNVDDTAQEREMKRRLLEEKLAAVRAQNRERKLKAEARTAAEQAAADRKEAAAERAKYEALRTGTFKETLEALGRDPREVFKEMQREAIEAGTPEGEIRKMRADFERQMGEKLKPLQETIDELKRQNEDLLEERRRINAEQARQAFFADFDASVKDAKWVDLRIEYGDKRLYRLVEGMKDNPNALRQHARELGVKLTYGDGRFNMQDIFNVLDAAHKAHDTEKKQRRDQMQAPTASQGAPPQAPANAKTVNGTAERRNAANPLGNDTAATNASAPVKAARLSKQGRIDRAINRNAARRG
jgi:hypothetical protein